MTGNIVGYSSWTTATVLFALILQPAEPARLANKLGRLEKSVRGQFLANDDVKEVYRTSFNDSDGSLVNQVVSVSDNLVIYHASNEQGDAVFVNDFGRNIQAARVKLPEGMACFLSPLNRSLVPDQNTVWLSGPASSTTTRMSTTMPLSDVITSRPIRPPIVGLPIQKPAGSFSFSDAIVSMPRLQPSESTTSNDSSTIADGDVFYTAMIDPVRDTSFLAPRVVQLCANIPTYWEQPPTDCTPAIVQQQRGFFCIRICCRICVLWWCHNRCWRIGRGC